MKHFLTVAGLLVLTIIYVNFISSVKTVTLARPLEKFPSKIGEFQIENGHRFDDEVISKLGVDDYIMWNYQDEEGYRIGLYVGFYECQTEGNLIHSPRHCMPGSGWQNVRPVREVSIRANEKESINQMYLQKGTGRKMLVHYWYQGRGRVVANEYLDRMYMIVDSLLKRRSDGAFIRITGPAENYRKAENKQLLFVRQVMPRLKRYLPQ